MMNLSKEAGFKYATPVYGVDSPHAWIADSTSVTITLRYCHYRSAYPRSTSGILNG